MPIIRGYRSKIASNSFTGKVNTRDFSALLEIILLTYLLTYIGSGVSYCCRTVSSQLLFNGAGQLYADRHSSSQNTEELFFFFV